MTNVSSRAGARASSGVTLSSASATTEGRCCTSRRQMSAQPARGLRQFHGCGFDGRGITLEDSSGRPRPLEGESHGIAGWSAGQARTNSPRKEAHLSRPGRRARPEESSTPRTADATPQGLDRIFAVHFVLVGFGDERTSTPSRARRVPTRPTADPRRDTWADAAVRMRDPR